MDLTATPNATELSADISLVLLVSCAGALGLAIGALIGWILRDRCDRKSPQATDTQPDDVLRLHDDMYHPGRMCRENDKGACADRFGDDRLARRSK